jgi:hypothetical protein
MASSFVLIHSPLVGPGSWAAVNAALAQQGHKVQVADLTGSLAAGPPYIARMVEAVSALVSGPAIFVGHSGAGPLLPALGRAGSEVEGYVFVDAGLPHPGRSWIETAPPELVEQLKAMEDGGWLRPWSEWWDDAELAELLPDADTRARFVAGCPRLPMALFEEVHPEVSGWPDARCAYLLLSEGYQESAEEARRHGWPVTELSSHHLGLITDPDRMATSLLGLAGRLAEVSPRASSTDLPGPPPDR